MCCVPDICWEYVVLSVTLCCMHTDLLSHLSTYGIGWCLSPHLVFNVLSFKFFFFSWEFMVFIVQNKRDVCKHIYYMLEWMHTQTWFVWQIHHCVICSDYHKSHAVSHIFVLVHITLFVFFFVFVLVCKGFILVFSNESVGYIIFSSNRAYIFLSAIKCVNYCS